MPSQIIRNDITKVKDDEYGIAAIRGPRGITNSLSAALK